MKKFKILSEDELYEKVLYSGESEEPFEELHKFKRKTFGDVFDRDFRDSQLRHYLKHIMNYGGKIVIEIER